MEPNYKLNMSMSQDVIVMILTERYMSILEIGYCDCCKKRTQTLLSWNERFNYQTLVLDEDTVTFEIMEYLRVMTSMYKDVCLVQILIKMCDNCKEQNRERNSTLEFYEMVSRDVAWYQSDCILVDGYENEIKMFWSDLRIDPEHQIQTNKDSVSKGILLGRHLSRKNKPFELWTSLDQYSNAVADTLVWFLLTSVLGFTL